MEAGLNLYSLRDLVQTREGFAEVLQKLKQAGYSYIQISGVPLSPQVIAEESGKAGLPVRLTHQSLDALVNDTQKVMDDNAVFGCKNIGLGWVPPEGLSDKSKLADLTEKLERVGQTMQKNGFTFFLHHHHNEFFKHGKQTALEFILENAPSVHCIVDTYWVQYGGENPVRVLERLSGRCECVHLKDYRLYRCDDPAASFVPHFAPVGSGTLDFPSIVQAAKKAGTKYFFVEQDDACAYPDPLGQVEESIRYIRNNL